MKKFYRFISYLSIIALIIIGIQSCKKDINIERIPQSDGEYFIDPSKALALAKEFGQNMPQLNNKAASLSSISGSSANINKSTRNITPVKDSKGSNAYYIINYNEGGFSIISADKRTMSILAFSESGDFKTDTIPQGLDQWLYSAKNIIDSVRINNIEYSGQDTVSRNALLKTRFNKSARPAQEPPFDPDECYNSSEIVGPLVTTKWGQGSGYNANCPVLACGPNGRAYTGCSTTSIAQIVKYHQFPLSYNYTLMANFSPTNETARLMGNIFNLSIDSYDCDGSGGNMPKTVTALKSLGYTGSTLIDYTGTSNYNKVKNELRANRPVIFSGGRKGSWFIFPIYEGGHQWVCDGFNEYYICGNGYLKLHMNWGWEGAYDGWYGFVGFNPDGSDFNYKSKVIIGIHP